MCRISKQSARYVDFQIFSDIRKCTVNCWTHLKFSRSENIFWSTCLFIQFQCAEFQNMYVNMYVNVYVDVYVNVRLEFFNISSVQVFVQSRQVKLEKVNFSTCSTFQLPAASPPTDINSKFKVEKLKRWTVESWNVENNEQLKSRKLKQVEMLKSWKLKKNNWMLKNWNLHFFINQWKFKIETWKNEKAWVIQYFKCSAVRPKPNRSVQLLVYQSINSINSINQFNQSINQFNQSTQSIIYVERVEAQFHLTREAQLYSLLIDWMIPWWFFIDW